MAFNLGRVIDCEGRLQRDFIEFARLWSDVKEDWLDDRCRRFEQEHLSTLGPSLSRFVTLPCTNSRKSCEKRKSLSKDDRQAPEGLE